MFKRNHSEESSSPCGLAFDDRNAWFGDPLFAVPGTAVGRPQSGHQRAKRREALGFVLAQLHFRLLR